MASFLRHDFISYLLASTFLRNAEYSKELIDILPVPARKSFSVVFECGRKGKVTGISDKRLCVFVLNVLV